MTADPKRMRELIAKLKALTVERGASEAEAIAAALKARELADKHGLSAEELPGGVNEPDSAEAVVGTGRVRYRPVDRLWPYVARFCRCAMFYGDGEALRIVYVGRPCDVELARWLHQVLKRSLDQGLAAFKETAPYRRRTRARRRVAAAAFVEEMAGRLALRLRAATPPVCELTARADSIMRQRHQLEDRGPIKGVTGIRDNDSARRAGRQAAAAVPLNAPIGGTGGSPPLLIGTTASRP